MKRVFICSRYAGDIPRNTTIAEQLCRKAIEQGYAPFAPHLLYTRFLNDGITSEHEAGIACGLTYMESCEEVWVFTGEGISDGMMREIEHAKRLGKPIIEIRVI